MSVGDFGIDTMANLVPVGANRVGPIELDSASSIAEFHAVVTNGQGLIASNAPLPPFCGR